MTAELLSGTKRSKALTAQLTQQVAQLKEQGVTPKLVVITVGDDPASKVYVGQKEKRAHTIGMDFERGVFPADITQADLHQAIEAYNNDPAVSGIIVQLPLPGHLDETAAVEAISPAKDVDGFHPYNLGRLLANEATLIPCTPKGIMDLLADHHIDVAGKHAVIVGRSQIVGLPMALLLTHANATVTVCHSRTQDLSAHIRQADILVAAAGNRDAIKSEDIADGAIVIDVAMNRNEDGKLCGDVDFDAVVDRVQAITPVPGGVGPMTVVMLMEQTIQCACRQHGIDYATLAVD